MDLVCSRYDRGYIVSAPTNAKAADGTEAGVRMEELVAHSIRRVRWSPVRSVMAA
jgi:hypothetical protein